MVTMNMISYEDERLGFFVDQRRVAQKRYDRLEKQIKPDEPYLSERRQLLSDCGRELSFYNDVIEMLENGVVPKSEYDNVVTLWADNYTDAVDKWERAYEDLEIDFENAKTNGAKEIFEEIENKIRKDINNIADSVNRITDPDAIDGQYTTIDTLEWVLDSIAELKKKYLLN